MRNRTFKVLNVLSFCLLFFALYLNFIYKEDNQEASLSSISAAAYGSMLCNQPENTSDSCANLSAERNNLAYSKTKCAHIVVLTK